MLNAGREWLDAARGLWTPATVKTFAGFILTLLAVWLVSSLILKIVNTSLKRVFAKRDYYYVSDRRAKTLAPLLKSMARYIVYFVAGLTILSKLGVPVTSFLAAAGIGGLAIGFGAQSLVRDVITGFFLLFEDQFAVGDYITVAGVSGVVEEMTLRVTRIRDFGGELHIVPNGKIEQITNHMGARMRVLVDVTVPLGTDIRSVEEVFDKLFPRFALDRASVKEGPLLLGLNRVDHTGMTLQVVARTDPGQQWAVERELVAAIWAALRERGIHPAIPCRHVVIHGARLEPEPGEGGADNADETECR